MAEFRSKTSNIIERAAESTIDTIGSTASAIGSVGVAFVAAAEAGIPIVVPFTKFLPLISEIGNIFNDVIEITQAAEHNKRTCDALLQRVYVVDLAVIDLKRNHRDNQDFFNNKNYLCLQNLVNVMTQIKKFIAEISQMKTLLKYIQAKSIEKTFKELCREFDSCISALTLSVSIKGTDEISQLKADQADLSNYIKEMEAGIKSLKESNKEIKDDVKEVKDDIKEFKNTATELSKEFSSTVLRVNAMNNTMERFMNESSKNQQSKIDNIFHVHKLKFFEYEKVADEKPRKGGRVTKWVNIINKGEEFAFKNISEKEDARAVQNQVTILKELHNWQNIIKFYGLTCEGNQWYLITEWADFGNLREFYTNYKVRFEQLKLRMALDIARGLNFLRTVEIVHRDIRAENILITLNETAKLANFKLSRYLADVSLNQGQSLERVRYCAPELLERAPDYKYDQKCEVYSFGILLWEIAEERIPFEGNDDILAITDLVRNKMYREPFSESNLIPGKYRQLEVEAVRQDPDFRPKITTMFSVLNDCYKESLRQSYNSSPTDSDKLQRKPSQSKPLPKRSHSIDQDTYAIPTNLPDFESFKYMTLTEAAKQHKMVDRFGKSAGDLETAYKCFEAYSNLTGTNRNQIKAKYYKAYYISRKLVKLEKMKSEEKDRIVAELFKEVADDEANEFPEAKVRYGDCLYNGKGVEQNLPEALKYFEKAAEDGFKVAMYNAGNLYFHGYSGKRDKEKSEYYMKLAAYNDYEPAIKFCKEHNIEL